MRYYVIAAAERLLAAGQLTMANQTMRLLPDDPCVLYVLDIDSKVEEFVEDFLSSRSQSGGDIAEFLLDEETRSARVKFVDQQGWFLTCNYFLFG